jgi:hypothetical protein
MLLVRQVSSMRWTYFVKREVDLHNRRDAVRERQYVATSEIVAAG